MGQMPSTRVTRVLLGRMHGLDSQAAMTCRKGQRLTALRTVLHCSLTSSSLNSSRFLLLAAAASLFLLSWLEAGISRACIGHKCISSCTSQKKSPSNTSTHAPLSQVAVYATLRDYVLCSEVQRRGPLKNHNNESASAQNGCARILG